MFYLTYLPPASLFIPHSSAVLTAMNIGFHGHELPWELVPDWHRVGNLDYRHPFNKLKSIEQDLKSKLLDWPALEPRPRSLLPPNPMQKWNSGRARHQLNTSQYKLLILKVETLCHGLAEGEEASGLNIGGDVVLARSHGLDLVVYPDLVEFLLYVAN